jgi:Tol biopolymer transport system component
MLRTILCLAALTLILIGCSNDQPLQPGSTTDQRVLFSRGIDLSNLITTIESSAADGSDKKTITPGTLLAPPRAGKMVYIAETDGGTIGIYVANTDGSNRITFASYSSVNAVDRLPIALAPDGTRVLYLVSGGFNDTLKISGIDGSNEIALGLLFERYAALSPDGSRVAFYQENDGGSDHNLVVARTDGTQSTVIAPHIETGMPLQISWSPDGARLLFAAEDSSDMQSSTSDLFIINADGTGMQNLTSDTLDQICSAWSPDGSKIAYTQGPGTYDLWIMNADGSGRKVLIGGTTGAEFYPEWSTDSRKILFTEGRKVIYSDSTTTNISVESGAGPIRVVDVGTSAVSTIASEKAIGYWIR